jgi:hypothetical protein
LRFLTVAAILPAAVRCASDGAGEHEIPGDAVSRSIQEVQETHTPEWMSILGVVGTGIGSCDDLPCIKVFVAEHTPELDQIPDEVEGYRVEVEMTGPFRAQDSVEA